MISYLLTGYHRIVYTFLMQEETLTVPAASVSKATRCIQVLEQSGKRSGTCVITTKSPCLLL